MWVSVAENEIVCYNVDNAITDAKMRGLEPVEKSEGARAFPAPPLPTPVITGWLQGRGGLKKNGMVAFPLLLIYEVTTVPNLERSAVVQIKCTFVDHYGGALGTSVKTKSLTSVRRWKSRLHSWKCWSRWRVSGWQSAPSQLLPVHQCPPPLSWYKQFIHTHKCVYDTVPYIRRTILTCIQSCHQSA